MRDPFSRRSRTSKFCLAIVWCALACLWQPLIAAGQDASMLDVNQAYVADRGEPVTYEIDFQVIVTAPYQTKTLRVWLPLPPSDRGQQVSQRQLSTFPQRVEPQIGRELTYGNEFAYFEFSQPAGAQIIRHRFQARVFELNWKLARDQIVAPPQWPDAFQPYLKRNDKLGAQPEFQATLKSIVPERGTMAAGLFSVLNWVDKNLKYDHVQASLRADAEFAFAERRGHCSDYHGLCATMGRSLGFPTRVTYGLNLFPKNSPSHCKLEAFLPPFGWVSFDVSETQRLVNMIETSTVPGPEEKAKLSQRALQRLHAGFRDNTWLLVTKGTHYDLVPPASRPVDVVRTIYAEADGVPLPDPDPANPKQREFGWMTAHEFKADRVVEYPFKTWKGLP